MEKEAKMKDLSRLTLLLVALVVSPISMFAKAQDEPYENNLKIISTEEKCKTAQNLRECEVWTCEKSNSKDSNQAPSCLLRQKYVCDLNTDCHDGHITSINQRTGIDRFYDSEYVYELKSYCWSVDECNEIIAACISAGGDFLPDLHGTDSDALKEGYCRLGSVDTNKSESFTKIPEYEKEEVQASQDFAFDCAAMGGGASTDPTGVDVCTTPDGEDIIVPLP